MIFFNRRAQKWTIFPMIILCNVAITLLFILNSSSFGLPSSWSSQFPILLIFNFLLSVGIFFIPLEESSSRGIVISLIFILQLGCKYIMTKPFSEDIWFEFFLIIIMMLEAILLLSTAEILALTAAVIFSVVFTNHNEVFWGIQMEERSLDMKLSLMILSLMFSSLSIIIKSAHNHLLKDRENLGYQKKIIQKLSTSNSELQKYANMAEEKSMMNERLKLTREIHDTVGYTMTNLLMMLEASTDLVKSNPVKLEELLHQALGITKNGHEEIRQSLRVLRNTKIKEKNSIESIRNLTGIFMESTGVNVRVEFGNLPWKLNKRVDHIIYRFLQEAMTNALTHGDAKKIEIQFWREESHIKINVEDDGKGSLDIEQGIGLKGMTERLSEVSGSLSYENTSMGFSIRATIPWSINE
ncbi:sensor histidine kinase [Oceanispirochaeta sp. M1]|uniref:sensor histidine kinase n=2 Tax=Oceanispirochaeta TaxID=2035349 RepID=UPI0014953D67|nr:sensor histidine kinase [Oceanispirochaeta sp. M1]